MRLLLACVFVACHAIAIALAADHAAAASFVFLVLAPLLACCACLFRARVDAGRRGWLALGAGMWLWTGGMVATTLSVLAASEAASITQLSMLLYVLYGVPLTFVLASPSQAAPRERAIDAALALALGWLFFVHTHTFAQLAAHEPAVAQLRLMFDVENVFIALFALVRFAASERGGERIFFRALALFALVYGVVAAWINHAQADVPFGTFADLLIDVPFLLLALLAANGTDAGKTRSSRLSLIVRAGSPLVLPLGLLLVSAVVVQSHPRWAIAGFVVALLGYGARSVLSQMQLLEQRAQLDALARIDPLTGLANRRQFDEAAAREFARARREARPLAVLMIDIDHFKQLNDSLGHATGDVCLRAVAGALAGAATRPGDLAARYGGEDFVVLLPDCTAEGARQVAERMRVEVQALALATPAGEGVVTASVGAAHAPSVAALTLQALLETADGALYEAKGAGRNRVALRVPQVAGAVAS